MPSATLPTAGEETRAGQPAEPDAAARGPRRARGASIAWPGAPGPASRPTACASACGRTRPGIMGELRSCLPPGWRAQPLARRGRALLGLGRSRQSARGVRAASTSARAAGRARAGPAPRLRRARVRAASEPRRRARSGRTFVHAGVVGWRGQGDRGARPQPQRQDDARGRADPGGSRRTSRTSSPCSTRAAACTRSPRRCRSAARAAATSTCAGRAPRSSAATSGTEPLPVGLVVLASHRPGARVAAADAHGRAGRDRDAGAHRAGAPAARRVARGARARGGACHRRQGRAGRGRRARAAAAAAAGARRVRPAAGSPAARSYPGGRDEARDASQRLAGPGAAGRGRWSTTSSSTTPTA